MGIIDSAKRDHIGILGLMDQIESMTSYENMPRADIDKLTRLLGRLSGMLVMHLATEDKVVYRHTGYPGGIRSTTYAQMLDQKPAEAVRRTVRGMLPKTRLGRAQLKKLKVYAGPTHPHQAQKPEPYEIEHARARN